MLPVPSTTRRSAALYLAMGLGCSPSAVSRRWSSARSSPSAEGFVDPQNLQRHLHDARFTILLLSAIPIVVGFMNFLVPL